MKKIILSTIFCLLQVSIILALPDVETTKPIKAEDILPIFPIIAEYEYAPVYVSQDIKKHPQYWRINATFDPNDASSVEIILLEKDKEQRIYYCNSEKNVRKRKMQGDEAILTKIDFKLSESLEQLPIYGFGFRDKKGQPILWRVIPTGKPSFRGTGINAVKGDSNLRIEYRDLVSTTIGEGSAVKIGDKIFEAEAWTEISSPPYFYAYRGSFTLGRHMGVLRSGNEKWSVVSKPKKLKKGGKWTLVNQRGLKRNLKIFSDNDNELVIDEVNPPKEKPSLIRVVLHITSKGYNLRAVEMRNRSEKAEEMRIKFEPELPIQTSDSKKFEGKFMISQGERENIVSGIISRKQLESNVVRLRWEPIAPAWAKSSAFESTIRFATTGYSLLTKKSEKGTR